MQSAWCGKPLEERKEKDDGIEKPIYQSVIDYLKTQNQAISAHVRSPNLINIHEWVIDQFEKGLKPSELTAGYVRKYCLINSKSLNPNTIKAYFEKWIHWDSDKVSIFEQQIPKETARSASDIKKGVKKKEVVKPRFDHKKPPIDMGEGWWKVTYMLNGEWLQEEIEAKSAMDSTRKIFELLNS